MLATELIYTDGACSANGSARATGGFGVYIATSAAFLAPIKINFKGRTMEFAHVNCSPLVLPVTNIRMEGLAIVSTLALYSNRLVAKEENRSDPLAILNACKPFKTDGMKFGYGDSELRSGAEGENSASLAIEIVTDSLFWMNVVQDWLPKWIAKGIAFEKKNPDILMMLFYYVEYLRQHGIQVLFTHVKSHQKGNRSAHADGNDIADCLATSAAMNTTTAFERKH